jgi:GxxExxY protein
MLRYIIFSRGGREEVSRKGAEAQKRSLHAKAPRRREIMKMKRGGKIMSENEVAKIVVDTAFRIHKELGPGLFESVYESIMDFELKSEYGLFVERQTQLPVIWKGMAMDLAFRPDLVIEKKVIVELKSIETLSPVCYKQLLTYLRLADIKLGLLINFNEVLIKNGIRRVVNGL